MIITKLQVAPVELIVSSQSSQSSSTCRASRASRVRRVERVERVEPVELCCSTSSTQPKCMGLTRRTCRVVSSRVESSQVEFGIYMYKRIAENRMQNRMWNSCLDLITREIWRINSPELNPLDQHAWENRPIRHRCRPKPKILPNSRKCCKWQFNSGYDRQSCKRIV